MSYTLTIYSGGIITKYLFDKVKDLDAMLVSLIYDKIDARIVICCGSTKIADLNIGVN